jgi:RNA polymerase sigma factor (sigma-70 family)
MDELESLVERARAGDLDAFSGIVSRFQDMAYGCAFAVVGDFHLAEDVTQEAFLEAYRSLSHLHEPRAFPGWFRQIVLHSCSRITRGRRKREVRLEAAAGVASCEAGPVAQAAQREMANAVMSAVRSLPDNERMVTSLFYINGYSNEEIAGFLEVPVSTVKNHVIRIAPLAISALQPGFLNSSQFPWAYCPSGYAHRTMSGDLIPLK